MGKIKVAIALPCFIVGGAQRMVYELARSLDKNSFEVCVICYERSVAGHLEDGLRSEGIDVRHIGPFEKIRVGALKQMASVLNDFSPRCGTCPSRRLSGCFAMVYHPSCPCCCDAPYNHA